MTGRVRWRPGASGSNLLGYVGTLPYWSFQIFEPGDPEHGQYKLMAQLPGVGTAAARSSDPDELKDVAEGWLVGFVASIGARFPGHVGCQAAPDAKSPFPPSGAGVGWGAEEEPGEPDPPWPFGDEADDQGGASEHPYLLTEDDHARG